MTGNRTRFVNWLEAQLGKPYVWGAKGPDFFDCSGLVTAGLRECGLPDWRPTHNAQRLFDTLPETKTPAIGDLAFYGPPGRITHVMVVWYDGQCLGASGGNSGTTKPTPGACVKTKKTIKYRRDFQGFRKTPLTWEGSA